MPEQQKDANDRLAQMIATEALAAEKAEAHGDPDEPLPPHVEVTRGKTFNELLEERPGDPERRARFRAELLRRIEQEERAARLIKATSADADPPKP